MYDLYFGLINGPDEEFKSLLAYKSFNCVDLLISDEFKKPIKDANEWEERLRVAKIHLMALEQIYEYCYPEDSVRHVSLKGRG